MLADSCVTYTDICLVTNDTADGLSSQYVSTGSMSASVK